MEISTAFIIWILKFQIRLWCIFMLKKHQNGISVFWSLIKKSLEAFKEFFAAQKQQSVTSVF